jgi:hypothetical protein
LKVSTEKALEIIEELLNEKFIDLSDVKGKDGGKAYESTMLRNAFTA